MYVHLGLRTFPRCPSHRLRRPFASSCFIDLAGIEEVRCRFDTRDGKSDICLHPSPVAARPLRPFAIDSAKSMTPTGSVERGGIESERIGPGRACSESPGAGAAGGSTSAMRVPHRTCVSMYARRARAMSHARMARVVLLLPRLAWQHTRGWRGVQDWAGAMYRLKRDATPYSAQASGVVLVLVPVRSLSIRAPTQLTRSPNKDTKEAPPSPARPDMNLMLRRQKRQRESGPPMRRAQRKRMLHLPAPHTPDPSLRPCLPTLDIPARLPEIRAPPSTASAAFRPV
ncbi:hypothetical protein HYPSUDRAFT_205902 [Hypholoma sublateritium FD-334 SS-4]|uniref:Uncharacterized protein n=1 Tax=Hypholoma sublateritium (strain FD-334 SS-4) TaxID=945553 RepID=A0A0D2PBY6_HYPSF|nr:hypothetical protein HYPSUDRAFT_205902 [Hypholoma sublateritium FD-334 SS-4]